MMKRYVVILSMPVLLSACVSNWDMQGIDPKDHYKAHPVKNRVETQTETVTVHFAGSRNRLTGEEIDALKNSLAKISPMAVESVQLMMPPSQMHNEERKAHLGKVLRAMGYRKFTMMTEPSDTVQPNEARIAVSYAAVIAPKCPDWRTSSVTTFSNTGKGGFGCATVNNLGVMVEDPHDLVRGESENAPDMERNSLALDKYRKGETSSGTDSGSTGSTTATTTSP